MIRFLIKLSFFLFFVFVIISFFVANPSSNHSSNSKNNETTTSDVIIAFKEALNDLGTFCDRNKETCKVGRSVLSLLGERAYYGARAVYEYLGHILGHKNNVEVSPNASHKMEIKKFSQNHKMLS
ncbi:hypothetical protein D1093_05000 [Bartonella kosoyi]|uniref:Uncharacterized protein n=1 Tax=Bartonella kosoyi TaxID=2133959 RepID=A0A5B9CW99_9HYPH|nr:DUF5330 domain-containing protein [Bartonella kosoyi]QEE08989.1 hypothetical protein D1093_05000 [Bartonella kosoyi]